MNIDIKKMVDVSKMYYQQDYSQQEIADRLNISRPTVSRILKQAREKGILKIEVIDPNEDVQGLAHKLMEIFQLEHCIVKPVSNYEDRSIKRSLGHAAAQYLNQIVKDGDIIGTSWGTTLYQVAQQLEPKNVRNVTVVQLNGGVSHSETNTFAFDIINHLGRAFNTVPYHLPLPAVVDQVLVKQAMVADRHIHRVLQLGEEANIAIFTVGEPSKESTLIKAGYFSQDELDLLFKRRVAGDICSRYFDIYGNICHDDLNKRTIGIDLQQLRHKSHAILVAGGMNRVDGIFGALQGRYANVLITDQHAARSLVEMVDGDDLEVNA